MWLFREQNVFIYPEVAKGLLELPNMSDKNFKAN